MWMQRPCLLVLQISTSPLSMAGLLRRSKTETTASQISSFSEDDLGAAMDQLENALEQSGTEFGWCWAILFHGMHFLFYEYHEYLCSLINCVSHQIHTRDQKISHWSIACNRHSVEAGHSFGLVAGERMASKLATKNLQFGHHELHGMLSVVALRGRLGEYRLSGEQYKDCSLDNQNRYTYQCQKAHWTGLDIPDVTRYSRLSSKPQWHLIYFACRSMVLRGQSFLVWGRRFGEWETNTISQPKKMPTPLRPNLSAWMPLGPCRKAPWVG